jgi:type II secretory pathway pseudopilin PulG
MTSCQLASTMRHHEHHHRSGITLLEVLISLGILSIGLASVVALIPAGGAQARKAQIEDRRGALGAAALNDIITRGALNPSTWSIDPGAPNLYRLVIDPLGNNTFPSAPGLTGVTIANVTAGSLAAGEVFRGQDDLVYDSTQSEDNPPVPMFIGNAKRASEGNFSWLATLLPATSDSNPQYFRLTVVEFHRRDTASSTSWNQFNVSSVSNPSVSVLSSSLSREDFRELLPVGTAVLVTSPAPSWEWRRVVMAAPGSDDSITAAELTFDRPVAANANRVFAFKGSVGYAERVVSLERNSPWTQ